MSEYIIITVCRGAAARGLCFERMRQRCATTAVERVSVREKDKTIPFPVDRLYDNGDGYRKKNAALTKIGYQIFATDVR